MIPPTPILLVIIGITGDLAKRKLLPAIEAIARTGALPSDFKIIGITRQKEATVEDVCHDASLSFVRDHLDLFQMDMEDSNEYLRLLAHLEAAERLFGKAAQRLFYVSVPPTAARSIIERLGTSGLARVPQTKLLLEKPFGVDYASAADLVGHIHAHFMPEQVYRIDHYLAKEMVQNLIVFREYNSLFRRTWNNEFIERIEIFANETIGIEGRAHFYEQTGALRDVVQSHLLQLAALTLMKPTRPEELKDVPARRHAALTHLHLASGENGKVRRGQYQGYRDEVQNEKSRTETYVELTLESDDPSLAGIPITLVTGKMLSAKTTEIRIYYKKDQDEEANELVLRLQPNEGIAVSIWSKRPGYDHERERKTLDFAYADHYAALPDAYEKVLVDVMRSDHDLFVSGEEVLESWRILAPVQEAWAAHDDLFSYAPGRDPSR